ncbi:hypothetical protein T484DRAFT_1874844, partial [Baffinella frigidus]
SWGLAVVCRGLGVRAVVGPRRGPTSIPDGGERDAPGRGRGRLFDEAVPHVDRAPRPDGPRGGAAASRAPPLGLGRARRQPLAERDGVGGLRQTPAQRRSARHLSRASARRFVSGPSDREGRGRLQRGRRRCRRSWGSQPVRSRLTRSIR